MGGIADSPLGKPARTPAAYDPSLLYPVERAPQRAELALTATLPFHGSDRWTAWELSWLDRDGTPRVAVARFEVPHDSPRIVESKSVKLYLTSVNDTRFDSADALTGAIERDLSRAVDAPVAVELVPPERWHTLARASVGGEWLDALQPSARPAWPDSSLLVTRSEHVDETLSSALFRSVCPVTGQPDFAEIELRYRGAAIERAGLLAYLLGYRHHPGFHEHCAERIFVDVSRACAPQALTVIARFTRRGGIDISPWRSNAPGAIVGDAPTPRQ